MISHVVVDAKDSGAFRCLHCGERHQPRLPMPCEAYVSACSGFILMHKHCARPAEPSKQVELFDELVKKEARASARLDGETRVYETVSDAPDEGMDDEPDPETKRPGDAARYVNGAGDGLNLDADRSWQQGGDPVSNLQAAVANARADHTRGPVVVVHDRVGPHTFGIIGHDKAELTTYAEYETGHYAQFAQMYPAARTFPDLLVSLASVLTGEQLKSLKGKGLHRLDPSSPGFQMIAHWARVEKARADSMASAQRGEPGEGGITIPLPPPMPLKLQQALGSTPKRAKKKSVRKPARKAKARK